jgi:hypothetical protein
MVRNTIREELGDFLEAVVKLEDNKNETSRRGGYHLKYM